MRSRSKSTTSCGKVQLPSPPANNPKHQCCAVHGRPGDSCFPPENRGKFPPKRMGGDNFHTFCTGNAKDEERKISKTNKTYMKLYADAPCMDYLLTLG